MTVSKNTIQRGAWGMLAAALILVGAARAQAPGAGMTPTNATVEVSTISQTDPHPTTYSWEGDVPVIKEPGANYYAFYYTGTVTPDARVPEGTEILRIPVKLNDWASNKRWILAQLTLFYQQTHNLPQTALQEYQAGPLAATAFGVPGAPAAPGAPGAQPGVPAPGGVPGIGPGAPGMGAPGMGAPGAPQGNAVQTDEQPRNPEDEEMNQDEEDQMAGGSIGGQGLTNNSLVSAFDPKVAAEWTFYYDQLVLWQYYCARNLLGKPDLLESLPPSQRTATQMLMSQVSGMTPQSLRSSTLRESQQMSIRRPGQPNQPMQGGDMDQFSSQYMNPEDAGFFSGEGGMGGMGGGGTQVDMQQVAVLREQFSPQRDYLAQSLGQGTKADEAREKYMEAAKQLDDQVYSQFMLMLKGIDDRQISNENFDKWVREKRQEVSTYADTWRKLEHGETIMIDNTMFLVSKEKLESVPNQTINVVKRERLTPADLLNADGTVRKPAEK